MYWDIIIKDKLETMNYKKIISQLYKEYLMVIITPHAPKNISM